MRQFDNALSLHRKFLVILKMTGHIPHIVSFHQRDFYRQIPSLCRYCLVEGWLFGSFWKAQHNHFFKNRMTSGILRVYCFFPENYNHHDCNLFWKRTKFERFSVWPLISATWVSFVRGLFKLKDLLFACYRGEIWPGQISSLGIHQTFPVQN